MEEERDVSVALVEGGPHPCFLLLFQELAVHPSFINHLYGFRTGPLFLFLFCIVLFCFMELAAGKKKY